MVGIPHSSQPLQGTHSHFLVQDEVSSAHQDRHGNGVGSKEGTGIGCSLGIGIGCSVGEGAGFCVGNDTGIFDGKRDGGVDGVILGYREMQKPQPAQLMKEHFSDKDDSSFSHHPLQVFFVG